MRGNYNLGQEKVRDRVQLRLWKSESIIRVRKKLGLRKSQGIIRLRKS